MANPSVLVMVLNYNSAEDTAECVESLLTLNYSNFSVLLMDNGSEDFDKLLKYEHYPLIDLLRFEENKGFTKAHNEGLKAARLEAKYDYIALINNDAVADENWLNEMILCAKNQEADLVSCCIKQYNNESYLDNVGHKMINTGEIVPIGFNEYSDDYLHSISVIAPCGAAMLVSSTCIDELGLFDPYFNTGYEDAELGLRCVMSGKKIIYNPKAIVYHKISQSVSKIDDLDYRIQQQANIYYSYFKLMPLTVILINLPFIILKYLLVLLVELLTFKWSYIGIHFESWIRVLRDWSQIKSARKEFFSKGSKISSLKMLGLQQFFLFFDFQRLFDFLFKANKTVFDKSLEGEKNI